MPIVQSINTNNYDIAQPVTKGNNLQRAQSTSPASPSKLERVPQTDSISFSNDNTIPPQQLNKEASTSKKWGVGIASFLIPGLGQLVNSESGKAAGFFFGSLAAQVLTLASIQIVPVMGFLMGCASLGLQIWSCYDAVKNAKAEY